MVQRNHHHRLRDSTKPNPEAAVTTVIQAYIPRCQDNETVSGKWFGQVDVVRAWGSEWTCSALRLQ
jgi:hypothetical protein